jgi:cytochrome c peroxidase
LAKALASFERTLLLGDSGVDRFRAADFSALTDDQRQGLWVFESKGRCWRCHSGANFADGEFHNTGVGFGRPDADHGRFEVTRLEADRGKFKTPTLRGAARTAPFMHDGSLATLRDVVAFYNDGGRPNPNLDPVIQPLGLSDREMGFLASFLEALSTSGSPPLNR